MWRRAKTGIFTTSSAKPNARAAPNSQATTAMGNGAMAIPYIASIGMIRTSATEDSTSIGSGANSQGERVTVMIWKKWADDERVKRHEGSVCRAPFRPGSDHPLCALVPTLQAQLS